jgi:hypothetical protein
MGQYLYLLCVCCYNCCYRIDVEGFLVIWDNIYDVSVVITVAIVMMLRFPRH